MRFAAAALVALCFSQGHDPAHLEIDRSDPAEQDQDHDDHEHQSQTAAGEVAPAAAVVPAWKRSEEHEDHDNDEYGSKHEVSPCALAPGLQTQVLIEPEVQDRLSRHFY